VKNTRLRSAHVLVGRDGLVRVFFSWRSISSDSESARVVFHHSGNRRVTGTPSVALVLQRLGGGA
jgi:hypothetical protein